MLHIVMIIAAINIMAVDGQRIGNQTMHYDNDLASKELEHQMHIHIHTSKNWNGDMH